MSPGADAQEAVVEEDETDEATLAFKALTREVVEVRAALALQHRAIAALAEAQGPDLSPTLAAIATTVAGLETSIMRIEQSSALRTDPEAFADRTARAIAAAMRAPLRQAEQAAYAIQNAAGAIEASIGSARSRHGQNKRLAQAAAMGLAAGLVLFPLAVFPSPAFCRSARCRTASPPSRSARTASPPA